MAKVKYDRRLQMLSRHEIEKMEKKIARRRKMLRILFAIERTIASMKQKKKETDKVCLSECITTAGYALSKDAMAEMQKESKRIWETL